MILFDSHAHINDNCYDDDLIDVIDRAKQANVKGIMIAGVDVKKSFEAVKIANKHLNIFIAVGIHPHNAKDCSQKALDELINIFQNNSCVKAWGETGLDYNRMFSSIKDQEKCFVNQLKIAGELDLPLILHERDSNKRFYDILKDKGPKSRKGVVHCFSGTKEELFCYLDLGYYIGITGILTLKQKGEHLRKLALHIPNDRILIETDSPYLTPAPQKNKTRRNEPCFVESILLKLAEIKNMNPDELSEIIFQNTIKLYNISS